MTADLFPEGAEVNYAPEKVSPAIAWLCSDESEGITGRQFVISGNRVSLLYPAQFKIAQRDNGEEAWDPSEIGQEILKSMEEWPKAANVPELVF